MTLYRLKEILSLSENPESFKFVPPFLFLAKLSLSLSHSAILTTPKYICSVFQTETDVLRYWLACDGLFEALSPAKGNCLV